MSIYKKYLVKNGDSFTPSHFPQLEESLEQVIEQLAKEPEIPKAEMVLAFVKGHSINSQQAKDHPELAKMILSGSLPLKVMEELFESGINNLLFRKGLEEYIRNCFKKGLERETLNAIK